MSSDKGFFGSPKYQVPLGSSPIFMQYQQYWSQSKCFDFSDSDQDEINDAVITKNDNVSSSSHDSDYEMILPGTGNDAQLKQENVLQSEIGIPDISQRPATIKNE